MKGYVAGDFWTSFIELGEALSGEGKVSNIKDTRRMGSRIYMWLKKY